MTDWADFPARVMPAGTPLHRIHRRGCSPAHFNTARLCRFDAPPDASSSYGVCYLAPDPLAAYVEVFGRFRAMPADKIARRCLSTAHTSRELRIADLTQRSVLGRYGVTAAHSTGSDYRASQSLSARLHAAGFDGILYRIRHDPSMALEAVAVFSRAHPLRPAKSHPHGPAGEPAPAADVDAQSAPFAWSAPADIGLQLIDEGREFDITVLSDPQLP